MSESLETRIARIEQALVDLADATRDWSGGVNDGAAYTDWFWRDEVKRAVDPIRELFANRPSSPGGTET